MPKANLGIGVSNLGPISDGNVTLRPLTIFIGPNNAGKTYFAQTVYSARKAVERAEPARDIRLTADQMRQVVDKAASERSQKSLVLPQSVQKEATSWILEALREGGRLLKDRVGAYFAVPDTGVIARWDQDEALSIQVSFSRQDTDPSLLLTTTGDTPDLYDELKALYEDRLNIRLPLRHIVRDIERHLGLGDEPRRDAPNFPMPYPLQDAIWNAFLQHSGLAGTAHYLPSGRSGLLAAWTDVVKLQGDRIRDRFGLAEAHSVSLGGVALDFITASARVLGPRRGRSPYHYQELRRRTHHRGQMRPATELLRQLMEGDIDTEADEDGIPILEYRHGPHAIPVQRASSMVADLAPLAMWIDHILVSGDLLIIDEPESHLHPAAIRKLARVLVRLVGCGIEVLCATHSPVLLHEISNCILRRRVAELEHAEIDGSASLQFDTIDTNDIAVYRFSRIDGTNPVTVSPIQVHPDWGISEDDFAEIAMDQINESAELHDQLNLFGS